MRAVVEMTAPAYGVDLVAIVEDEAATEEIRAHVEPRLHPDFEVEATELVTPVMGGRRGADALIDSWRELLSVFSFYRPQLMEVVDAGNGRVGLLSEDTIRTRDGIDLTIPVGGIYDVEDGLVRRAAFVPDQVAVRARLSESRDC